MERKYAAFISYRHTSLDMTTAKTLHSLIEQYRVPKSLRKNGQKKLGIVFRDQDELPASSNLNEKICQALDNTEYLIVICTPNTPKSPWVEREISYFLSHHDREHVLAVLAEGEPDESFPKPLTQYRNPQTGELEFLEPLAVDIRAKDVRASMAKLRKEVKRIFAAMLDCPYDALILREQRRQRQRILGFMSVALTVALSFSAVLMVKNREIDRKNVELEDKNEELARQREAVLLRESELLTQNARESLAQGDYLDAISSAVSALPGGTEEDRPYYAPAEEALLSALDIFGQRDKSTLIADTKLTQMTPVNDYYITADGKSLITMDPYNLLTCYDTVTAQVRWSTQGAGTSAETYGTSKGMMIPCPSKNSLIVFYNDYITAYDLSTGEARWSYQDTGSSELYLFLAEDESKLAYLHTDYHDNFADADYYLGILDTATGQLQQAILVAPNAPIFGTYFTMSTNDDPAVNGTFSTNGTLFAGSYARSIPDGGYEQVYFVADLTAGTCRTVHTGAPVQYITALETVAMKFIADDSRLLTVRRSEDALAALTLMNLDVTRDALLWEVTSPQVEDTFYFSNQPACALVGEVTATVSCADMVYTFDLETGQLLASTQAPGSIVDMFYVGSSFFGYVTADGYYAIAWRNANGIFDSSHFFATAQLGPTAVSKNWAEGFIHAQVEDNSIAGITVTGEPGGFMAVVTPEDSHTVVIKRVVDLGRTCRSTAVESSIHEGFFSYEGVQLWQDRVYLGKLSTTENEKNTYHILALDTHTHQQTQLFSLVDGRYGNDVYFLADGTGYVDCNGRADIILYRNGTQTILSQEEQVELMNKGGISYVASKHESHSAMRLSDQKLVTVRSDGQTLDIWLDGQDMHSASLPENVKWAYENPAFFSRFVRVGHNGYVLMSCFSQSSGENMTGFAAYDSAADTWTIVEDAAQGLYSRVIAMGKEKASFAVIDADGYARVYDMQTGEMTGKIPLQLPHNSFEDLEFILEDGYLAAQTEDKQVLIYEIASGRIVYRVQMEANFHRGLAVYEDPVNQRLYLCADHSYSVPNGLCLDITTWTKLMEIRTMLCYVPQTNEVYCYRGENITAYVIPGTAELVALGKTFVSN